MITTPSTETPTPGMPSPIALVKQNESAPLREENIYTLFFLQRGQNKMCERSFRFPGTLYEAIARAKTHCEKMAIRFVRVEPFIVDLDVIETRNVQSYG